MLVPVVFKHLPLCVCVYTLLMNHMKFLYNCLPSANAKTKMSACLCVSILLG